MRILLFGDDLGIPRLLRHLSMNRVCVGLVAASNRPRCHDAVRQFAAKFGLEFALQPAYRDDNYGEFVAWAKALQPDLIWVSSYSMIVREDVLNLARLGGINIHGALLPHNRGCNPSQWAIINGETETGVTLHELTAGVDEGPIIDQRQVPILFEDTWLMVRDRMARAADDLIATNLPTILSGSWVANGQDERAANYCRRRTPEDGLFTWSQPVVSIYNHIRALLPPLPPAFYLDGDAQQVSMNRYLTPAEVTALKYGSVGGGVMQADRVRLRPLRRADAPLLYEWITHRELVILNAPFYPVSEVDHEAWVDSMLTRRMDLVIFVIEDVASNKAIGSCQLLNINWRHCSAELQIRIGNESFHGKGYGTEAVNLLCRFGFADLNLHRIYLHAFETNSRAIRSYEKSGFVQEGSLKEAAYIDGKWLDVAVMGLIENNE